MIVRTIIILIVIRICITLMTVLTGNVPDECYVEIPRWLAVLFFFPFKAPAYQVIGIPLNIGWYAIVLLFIAEWIFKINLNRIIDAVMILTLISTALTGLFFVVKRKKL